MRAFPRRPTWLRLLLAGLGGLIVAAAWVFDVWVNALGCAWVINGPCTPHYFDPEIMAFVLPATGLGLVLIAVAWATGGQFEKN